MPPDPPDLSALSSPGLGDSGVFPRIARASVIVDGHETPYLRLGHGAPALVVAVGSDSGRVPEWTLVTTLAALRRVTVVETPASPTGALAPSSAAPVFATWLAGLLDGLGIAHAAIIAAESHALRVLHFALAHGDRVERLLLLANDQRELSLPIVGTVGTSPSIPLLIAASPGAASHALHLPTVAAFVSRDRDCASG